MKKKARERGREIFARLKSTWRTVWTPSGRGGREIRVAIDDFFRISSSKIEIETQARERERAGEKTVGGDLDIAVGARVF